MSPDEIFSEPPEDEGNDQDMSPEQAPVVEEGDLEDISEEVDVDDDSGNPENEPE